MEEDRVLPYTMVRMGSIIIQEQAYPETVFISIPRYCIRIGTVYPSGNGVSFVQTPTYYAFKSSGDGKAYYVKPIIHNISGQITPIFQAELWFPGANLAD